jgi:hypothetical protein
MTYRPLSEDVVEFRRRVIDRLVVDGAAGYITEDTFTGKCPVCLGDLWFRFHGHAKRVTVECLDGCTEGEIGERLGLEECS